MPLRSALQQYVQRIRPRRPRALPEPVADTWEFFRAKALPDAAPAVVTDCRRAFYAGAYFTLLNAVVGIGGDDDEARATAALEALEAECLDFLPTAWRAR